MKIIRQRDLKDCGVCALASIIEHYNGHVPLEKIRMDTFTDSEGTTAFNLLKASEKYGFESLGVKVDSLSDEIVKYPAIAHIITKSGFEHFVVIYKVTPKLVYIMDPAKGRVIMPLNEFKKQWDNILLLFYPRKKILLMSKPKSLWDLFIEILKKEKKLFIIIFLMSLFLVFFTIISSYYSEVILKAISKSENTNNIKVIIFIFSMILGLKLLYHWQRTKLENYLNKNIDVYVLSNFLSHLFQLPFQTISTRSSGEIITRFQELTQIKNFCTDIVLSFCLDFLLFLSAMPILYNLNQQLFLILLGIIAFYLGIGLITSSQLYKMAYQNITDEAEFNNTLIEKVNMLESIKNLNQIVYFLKKIENKLAKLIKNNFYLNQFLNTQSNFKYSINEIGLFLINTGGFCLIIKNKLTIAELLTFNTLIIYFLDPLKNIIDTIPKINFLKASFSKLNEFLSIEKENLGKLEKITNNSIKIINLKYSYNNYNLIIDNLNINISKNEFVLLKGSSGCGKSTLCKIIAKNIENYEGKVLIGAINIKDYSLSTIRNYVTYISQNEKLFTGTIKDNILLNRNVSLEKFDEVCRICLIDEIVDKKPFRYETIINNEITFLSGGERQRIILARALLKSSTIYLIDEALSEVDFQKEKIIIKNLQKYLSDKTVIYITHKNQEKVFRKIINLNGLRRIITNQGKLS